MEPSLWIVPWWVFLLLLFAVFFWKMDDAKGVGAQPAAKGGMNSVALAALVGIVVVLIIVGLSAIPTTQFTAGGQGTFNNTLSEGTEYDFTYTSADGSPAPAGCTTDLVLNDQDKTVGYGITGDDSAGALYCLGTTTAYDSAAWTMTLTRSDDGWKDPGEDTVDALSVSFSLTGATGWEVQANGTATGMIKILDQDALGVYAIAWTVGGATQVGDTDVGSLCLLDPGESCAVTLTLYFNEDSLPNTTPYTTNQFSGSVVIAMERGMSQTIDLQLQFQNQL